MNEFTFSPNPLAKILIRMIAFGILFGGIVGFLAAMIYLNGNTAYPINGASGLVMTSFIVGGTSGLIYGALGGIVSGAAMILATAILFRGNQRFAQIRIYYLAMGIISFVLTGLIYINQGLIKYEMQGDSNTGAAVILLSALIAACVSLYVSRVYLRESALVDTNKLKP